MITLLPVYTESLAPSEYFFRWNDEIKSLRQQAAGYGIGGYYAPFAAGFQAGFGLPGFYAVYPGLVVFGGDTNSNWADPFTMAHEFGHFLQFKLQGNQLGGGGPHSGCFLLTDDVAFSRGICRLARYLL